MMPRIPRSLMRLAPLVFVCACVQQQPIQEPEHVIPVPATNPLVAKEVKARLSSIPGLAGSYQIRADISGSHVTLSGTAHRRADIDRIVRRISSIPGVSGVDNQIRSTSPITDEGIRTEVLDALERDPDLRGYGIAASVRAGVVTLRGELPDSCLIDKALTETTMVDGVKDLRNELTINGKPYHPSAHCPGYEGQDID